MNIFEKFLINFKSQILENKNKLNLNNLNEFKGVVVEKPPVEFNFDLSCNISLILAKLNNQNPRDLAIKIKSIELRSK